MKNPLSIPPLKPSRNSRACFRAAAGILLVLPLLAGCNSSAKKPDPGQPDRDQKVLLASEMEENLLNYVVDAWYPRNLDTVYGGYISVLSRDWSPSPEPGAKSLVQQARHLWATSYILEHYPEKTEFMDYAEHGFRFLKEYMWDNESGGFFSRTHASGTPTKEALVQKFSYGQAFAIYALSQFYMVSGHPEALSMAREAFLWLDTHAWDPEYGGYFEHLARNGDPLFPGSGRVPLDVAPPLGLKEYNSSIHLMEALTSLYRVWPDSTVHTRLQEMFYLIRDTMVHPEGYLQLYFYPDWKLVPDSVMAERSGGNAHYSQHITYGHDVETAYLLLETADMLGMGEDSLTHAIAKRLVDHSLASGWDDRAGGFFYTAVKDGDSIRITGPEKSWWTEAEGLNALLLMHTLYPGDPANYYDKFLKIWHYIDRWLIDKEYGGWFNEGIDTSPESIGKPKSHEWKTSYHTTRTMVNCIHMLRE